MGASTMAVMVEGTPAAATEVAATEVAAEGSDRTVVLQAQGR